ncbi:transcription factor bHLH36-like [Andrographis paniculata]|uniref:transcription factor bHLH36-like n=1 Tax=Andrographis paniculata TaxID=175694 RepID=UPI0021E6F11E|nr:transcription factor bHLH36-like [Andrographis paniculata]
MDHQSSHSSCPFFPLEDLSIDCPDITFWDSSLDHVLHPPEYSLFGDTENHKGKGKESDDGATTATATAVVKEKKLMHREIERQRRQEMSGLYASLRSVLPAHVLKGKRSISDQIYEATKYIKFQESRIRDLGNKREACRRGAGAGAGAVEEVIMPETAEVSGGTVTVEACSVGAEVLISGDFELLPLSRVLAMLVAEGLEVVSCNFTKFDGRSCYMIQSQVRSGHLNIHLQGLQRKLSAFINTL